jgi:hypothetical protein
MTSIKVSVLVDETVTKDQMLEIYDLVKKLPPIYDWTVYNGKKWEIICKCDKNE